jgi:pectin methylesterase-like acyl-CoA thioesterase
VQVSDAGSYNVVVSNSSGSVTSATADLLVVSGMTLVNVAPFNGQTEVCGDRQLRLEFDQAIAPGKTGRISIYNTHGTLVDVIDMAASPQTRTIGGAAYAYYPVIVTGSIADIYPHRALAYGETYYVLVEPGVVADVTGAPFAGISDPNQWRFTVRANGPADGTTTLTVTGDGSGDFCTVQGAIDFVPANNTRPVTITVRPGVYTEIVYVPSSKPFITVHGDNRDTTLILYANNNNLNPSTAGRALFGVDASDFTLQNITLWNTTPHGGSQAEAFRGNGQRILLNRVTLRSFQDTLLLQGGGFVTDSFIEGDVDFLWGNGPVFIQNCEVKAATSGGYYTQIRNPQGQGGYVFVNSRLTSEPGVTGMYLGRIDPTVFPYSQVVYLNCAMGSHILPAGWLLNNATAAPSVQFWEYHSTDTNGRALEVSQRAPFSRQLSAQEAALWLDPSPLLSGWVPYTVGPDTPTAVTGGQIGVHWSAAPGHSAKDWVGLYHVGDPDASVLAWQYTGSGTTGHVTLTAPPAGQYEVRYFLSDGFTRAASGDRVTVF